MAHLEVLVAEYLDWQGFLVKRNVKVGRLAHGGWEGELDVVGYKPDERRIVHYELSLDASPWTTREARYEKKMKAGRTYIKQTLFPWLPDEVHLEQIAVFPTIGERTTLAGAKLMTVDMIVQEIVGKVSKEGRAASNAISEYYPLLRAIQLAVCGYSRAPKAA
jgi:hypothetical protein